MIEAGDDLADVIGGFDLRNGDILVVAQKVVSKAEGRLVPLAEVTPSREAHALAEKTDKDPRLVELVLRESKKVLRASPGRLIVEHRLGFIMANAGIDASNVGAPDHVILLPEAPDLSARRLADSLKQRTGCAVGVVISDSWGRPWRLGTVGFAIGLAGLPALLDLRGREDLAGRTLEATTVATGDELAAAASILMGQADEGTPVVVVRGLSFPSHDGRAAQIIRPESEDMFR